MEKYRPVAAMVLSRIFADREEFLIVRKPRQDHSWQFPQGGVEEHEDYLRAAERELYEECGEDLQIIFLYSWPVGEYHYDFPEDFDRYKGEYKGSMVKFYRGIWEAGEVKIDNKEIVDHKWVEVEEFEKYFDPEYLRVVEDFT